MNLELFIKEFCELIGTIEQQKNTYIDHVYRVIGLDEVNIRYRTKKNRPTWTTAGYNIKSALIMLETKTGVILDDFFYQPPCYGSLRYYDMDDKSKHFCRFEMGAAQ